MFNNNYIVVIASSLLLMYIYTLFIARGVKMSILHKIRVDCYNYENLNYKPANVVFISRDMYVKLVKEVEWQLGILITDYNKLKVNGRVNDLDIYEVVGKENILHVSRI